MTADEYIMLQTTDQQQILRRLRQLILTSADGVREKVNWNVPFYTHRGQWFCYLNVLKAEPCAVDIAFLSGHELPDEAGLLEERGRKMVKSLVVRNRSDFDEDVIRTYIQEALLLCENRRFQRRK